MLEMPGAPKLLSSRCYPCRFIAWRGTYYSCSEPFPTSISLNIYQHAGIDGRRLLARRAAEIRSDVVLLLVQPSLLICKVGCFWSFCHQPNNLFNSLPVFDSAMQIDSGGSAEGMIKSPGWSRVEQHLASPGVSRNGLCSGAWPSVFS